MIRNKVAAIAGLVLATSVGQLTLPGLSAFADDTASLVCTDVAKGEFPEMLAKYVKAFNADDRIHKTIYASRVRKTVFAHPGSPDYVAMLEYIDGQQRANPEAIYDLAKGLQLHWETQFAVGLGERQARREGTGAKIGAIVAITALGIAVIKNPRNAPKYFRVVRWLLPAAGAAAGSGVAHGLNASGMLDKHVPVAPAHVMHLGIVADDYNPNDETVVSTLAEIGAGFAATEIAYLLLAARAAKYVNMAATPAKINPLVLIASIVIGIAVEEGVKHAVDSHMYNKRLGQVTAARSSIDRALNIGADAQAYSGADALLASTTNFAAYVNKPLIEAVTEYNSDVADIAKKYNVVDEDNAPAGFKRELDILTGEFSRKVRDVFNDQDDSPIDEDYRAISVLGYLLNHDEDSIAMMGDDAKERADFYTHAFRRWLAADEARAKLNFGQQLYDEAFHRFIQGMYDAKTNQLAEEFRGGKIRRNANHTILQAASFLRSTGKEYVEDQVNALMSMIARNDMLVAGVTNGASTQPYPNGGSGAEGGSGSDWAPHGGPGRF